MSWSKHRNNVAAISTAMYAGRKLWFVQSAARYFRMHPCHTLVEAFAGSAVVGLSLLYSQIIESLILVEKDPAVVCLLNGMLTDPSLADRYAAFECTRENVNRVLSNENDAFSLLVRSRVSHSARWWGGNRPEIDSRWCPNVVVPNLRRVYELRDRVTVLHGDAFDVLPHYQNNPTVGCFADPPYSADPRSKGHTMYRFHQLSHPQLFSILAREWQGPWLMCQDATPTVRRLALCHRLHTRRVRMTAGDNTKKDELVIRRKRPLF